MAVDAGRDLLLLGILREGPMSAYELTRAVKMHSALYRALTRGNIYEVLGQFETSRWVKSQVEHSPRGPRKAKTVYRLSAGGKRRFESLLHAIFADPQASDATVEVACVLLASVPRQRLAALFDARLRALGAHAKRLERVYGGRDGRSAGALLALGHAKERIKTEIAWAKSAKRALQNRSV